MKTKTTKTDRQRALSRARRRHKAALRAGRPGGTLICFLYVGPARGLGQELGKALKGSGFGRLIKDHQIQQAWERGTRHGKKLGKGIDAFFEGRS